MGSSNVRLQLARTEAGDSADIVLRGRSGGGLSLSRCDVTALYEQLPLCEKYEATALLVGAHRQRRRKPTGARQLREVLADSAARRTRQSDVRTTWPC